MGKTLVNTTNFPTSFGLAVLKFLCKWLMTRSGTVMI